MICEQFVESLKGCCGLIAFVEGVSDLGIVIAEKLPGVMVLSGIKGVEFFWILVYMSSSTSLMTSVSKSKRDCW